MGVPLPSKSSQLEQASLRDESGLVMHESKGRALLHPSPFGFTNPVLDLIL
jgi:hypothetical protein